MTRGSASPLNADLENISDFNRNYNVRSSMSKFSRNSKDSQAVVILVKKKMEDSEPD